MSKSLVVVESPAKARTLKRYLGKDFEVLASYGHVRDLLPKSGAVDTENGFKMHYRLIEKNAKHVDAIARALRSAEVLYLATDPDREGEAIAWHLYELLRERGALDGKKVRRVVFHEVTSTAIEEAVAHPRGLSRELIDAQQARRALDYLVGFNLSPLLWKKIRRGLSAGRVQSPALRMIVEREEEIERFKPREYWTLDADLRHQQIAFTARLTYFNNEKLTQFSIENRTQAERIHAALQGAVDGGPRVVAVEKKQRRRQPPPPFITSTLQQDASRKLGFTTQRTMRIAQQLYEGIDVGEGAVGLITYMRTDSVDLANEAIADIRTYIARHYGPDKLPSHPRHYKTTAKNAQEAHEAIRPTSMQRVPSQLRHKLNEEQFKLYELIWKRALACQMKHATIDTVAVDLECGAGNLLRATGSTVADPGFMAVYEEGRDDPKADGEDRALPALAQGDRPELIEFRAEQHFTEPPPRYSEASLVKSLEEYGIGRPSTYANIISTLLQREYAVLEKKRFMPTEVGRIVNKFLTEHFGHYVDYDFTARLEDELDAIARGEKRWVPVMQEFWSSFGQQVREKEENVSRKDAARVRELGRDPRTGRPITVRMGRYGPFVQIGSRDDSDKPQFAGLRPGQRIDTITLEEALNLFKLPRSLGKTSEGEEIEANIGRYGPYIRYGRKFVSLGKDDDPYTVTLERALELIREKQARDAAKEIKVFKGSGIAVLRGRYGPYVTDGKKNARVPKDRSPESLSLEESRRLLEQAPPARSRRRPRKAGAG
jgi:DNA topoisomerase-1